MNVMEMEMEMFLCVVLVSWIGVLSLVGYG